MIAAARMLKRHLLNLLNYHHYRLTNATAEGLNSRIQAIKADARGFLSFQNFRNRILLHLGKILSSSLVKIPLKIRKNAESDGSSLCATHFLRRS